MTITSTTASSSSTATTTRSSVARSVHHKYDIVENIGHTPLIELNSFAVKNVKLYAKLEWFNPFGSVKDRAALWMIRDAEKRGILKKHRSIIIDPTSGNT